MTSQSPIMNELAVKTCRCLFEALLSSVSVRTVSIDLGGYGGFHNYINIERVFYQAVLGALKGEQAEYAIGLPQLKYCSKQGIQ